MECVSRHELDIIQVKASDSATKARMKDLETTLDDTFEEIDSVRSDAAVHLDEVVMARDDIIEKMRADVDRLQWEVRRLKVKASLSKALHDSFNTQVLAFKELVAQVGWREVKLMLLGSFLVVIAKAVTGGGAAEQESFIVHHRRSRLI